jgi:ribonucleoside-diphosphate reductase beta chain
MFNPPEMGVIFLGITMPSVFKVKPKNHLESNMFLDGSVDIARYDIVRYPHLDKLTDKQLGFFWRPEEIDLSKDRGDFNALNDFEKHIFTSNLKRQILLDSVQGRSPNLAFLPVASLPEVETLVATWAFFETIHSRSYTHIIRNVYPNPSVVFDDMLGIREIVDCAHDISKYYDDFIEYSKWHDLIGEGVHTVNDKTVTISGYELKKKLFLTLLSVNILEGIRFYVSFACSWAFAELKKMEGNAKVIKMIARDENTHLAASTTIIKNILKEDPDYEKIRAETESEVIEMFKSAVEQEKTWAKYLFKDGSMIGLNEKLLSDYIEWIGSRRMKTLGFTSPYHVPQANPLPWTERWISGGNVQVAPQETEISSYVVGGVKQDVDSNTFKGLSL